MNDHQAMLETELARDPSELDLSGRDTTLVIKIYFKKLVEQDGMQAQSPEWYEAFLIGLDTTAEPFITVSNLQASLFEADEKTGEPIIDMVISEEDYAQIPLRAIDELYGATATPGGWEAAAKRDQSIE